MAVPVNGEWGNKFEISNCAEMEISIIGEKISDLTFVFDGKQLGEVVSIVLHNVGLETITCVPTEKLVIVEELDLSSNELGDCLRSKDSFRKLCELPVLKHLDLSANAIDSLEGLPPLPQLERLSLAFNNITSLECLSRLPNLLELDLRGNPIADAHDFVSCLWSTAIEKIYVGNSEPSCTNQTDVYVESFKKDLMTLYRTEKERFPPTLLSIDGVSIEEWMRNIAEKYNVQSNQREVKSDGESECNSETPMHFPETESVVSGGDAFNPSDNCVRTPRFDAVSKRYWRREQKQRREWNAVELEELRRQNDRYEELLEASYQSAEKMLAECTSNLQLKEEECAMLRRKLDAKMQASERESALAEEAIKSATNAHVVQVAQLQEYLRALEAEQCEQQTHIASLQKELSLSEKRCSALTERCACLEASLEATQELVAEIKAEGQSSSAAASAALAALKGELGSLENNYNSVKRERDDLQMALRVEKENADRLQCDFERSAIDFRTSLAAAENRLLVELQASSLAS